MARVGSSVQGVHSASRVREALLALYRSLERGFDAAFGSALNPLRHLGALGFMLFWLLAVSGIYLYAVLDTSASGAYASIDKMSREQWTLGRWLRSVHRYAADAFVLVTLAHLLREWLFGHCHGFRRFSWWTGVPLLLVFGLWFHIQRIRPAPIAVVNPANCNGCRRCFDDCPFAAVTMVPHPIRATHQMAQVNADLCASCGICVGACPSSTPFRSSPDLVTGIDMPSRPIGALRRQLRERLALLRASNRIVVFGCDRGARVDAQAAPDVVASSLMCTGMLPPSFVESALRDGAAGVLVSGCRVGGCEFRLGRRWAQERLAGTREPHLRASVPRESVVTAWADAGDEGALHAAVNELRSRLRGTAAQALLATAAAHG